MTGVRGAGSCVERMFCRLAISLDALNFLCTEAQLGHYETILEEMRGKLRNQVRFREGRFEFVPKETGQYDDRPPA